MTIALDVTGLSTQPTSGATATYAAIAVALAVLAVALGALAVLLRRPRRAPLPDAGRGAHMPANAKASWHRRIDEVVQRHAAGEIADDEAYARLAAIVRAFASAATGTDMSSRTLADLSRLPRSSANAASVDLLRHTIAALYPPEFANDEINAQARAASVEQAGEWASNLVERWR